MFPMFDNWAHFETDPILMWEKNGKKHGSIRISSSKINHCDSIQSVCGSTDLGQKMRDTPICVLKMMMYIENDEKPSTSEGLP